MQAVYKIFHQRVVTYSNIVTKYSTKMISHEKNKESESAYSYAGRHVILLLGHDVM